MFEEYSDDYSRFLNFEPPAMKGIIRSIEMMNRPEWEDELKEVRKNDFIGPAVPVG